MMKEDRYEKLKISNDLLDAMLVGVRTQEDLWGKEGIITQLNKALLERILNAHGAEQQRSKRRFCVLRGWPHRIS